jgi:hypothetical protein
MTPHHSKPDTFTFASDDIFRPRKNIKTIGIMLSPELIKYLVAAPTQVGCSRDYLIEELCRGFLDLPVGCGSWILAGKMADRHPNPVANKVSGVWPPEGAKTIRVSLTPQLIAGLKNAAISICCPRNYLVEQICRVSLDLPADYKAAELADKIHWSQRCEELYSS